VSQRTPGVTAWLEAGGRSPAGRRRITTGATDPLRHIPDVPVFLQTRRSGRQTGNMTTLKHSESIVIARSPETPPYDLVSDITLMYGDMEPGVQSVLVGRGS